MEGRRQSIAGSESVGGNAGEGTGWPGLAPEEGEVRSLFEMFEMLGEGHPRQRERPKSQADTGNQVRRKGGRGFQKQGLVFLVQTSGKEARDPRQLPRGSEPSLNAAAAAAAELYKAARLQSHSGKKQCSD